MKRTIRLLGVGLLLPLVLNGCDSIRSGLGLDHYQPDEFAVSDNPTLSIPKDLKLRPPRPGAKPTHAIEAPVRAKKAIGLTDDSTPRGNTSEMQFIAKAKGNRPVNHSIRDIVDRESEEDDSLPGKVMSKVRSWKDQAAHNVNPSHKPLKPGQSTEPQAAATHPAESDALATTEGTAVKDGVVVQAKLQPLPLPKKDGVGQ